MDQAAAAGNGVASGSGPVKLTLTRRVPGLFDRKLHVTDGEGSLLFRTVSVRPAFNFRLRTVLADASGNHLMRFRRKMVKEKPAFSIGGKGYTISVNQNEDLDLILVFLAIRHEKFRDRRMNLYTMGIAHAVNAAVGLFF